MRFLPSLLEDPILSTPYSTGASEKNIFVIYIFLYGKVMSQKLIFQLHDLTPSTKNGVFP